MAGALIILSGLPGSGKTYLAEALVKSGVADKHVSSDAIRAALFPRPMYTKGENNGVFHQFSKMITEGLNAGQRVVADATHMRRVDIDTTLNAIDDEGPAFFAPTYVIKVEAPQEIRKQRVFARTYPSPMGTWGASGRMAKNTDVTDDDCNLIVDGTADIDKLVGAVRLLTRMDGTKVS